MNPERLNNIEKGVSNRLAGREKELKESFLTSENNRMLNLEVLALRAAHFIVSAVATVSEIITPRRTE